MPSITVTRTGLAALLICLPPAPAPGGDAIDRIVAAVRRVADGPVPSAEVLRAACDDAALCVAKRLAEHQGSGARLERVRHPDSDTIRWVTSAPSVTSVHREEGGSTRLRLDRFGRKAVREVLAAAAPSTGQTLVIDLRSNAGGDFDRMLRVAALFTGPVAGAVRLSGPAGTSTRSLPASERVQGHDRLEILVGPETASSAEVLAALLRVHAGARILGRRTHGKSRLTRVVPVTHDWRLLVAAERIQVPGTRIAGGIRPDAALND